MAEADQRDLLPCIAVPTLLIWGELDERSPLSVARQFEQLWLLEVAHVTGARGHDEPRIRDRVVRERLPRPQ
jgi:pimeloyl-ACP methyl ester carboxylesterase